MSRLRLARPVLAALALILASTPAAALELSGVLIYSADGAGERVGGAWHTASGLRAGPLALMLLNPPAVRTFDFLNDRRGEVDLTLPPGTHFLTLLLQAEDSSYPSHLVVNLYFNRDKRSPGISLLVPHQRGFTHARLNPAFATQSLYLEDVGNAADLAFDGGLLQARAGAAFYFHTSGYTPQWMPGDFYRLDRVGAREIEPDGEWDTALVVELHVGPSPRRPPVRWQSPPPAAAAPRYVPPLLLERGTPAMLPAARPTLVLPTPRTTSTAATWPTAAPTVSPPPTVSPLATALTPAPTAPTAISANTPAPTAPTAISASPPPPTAPTATIGANSPPSTPSESGGRG